MDSYSRRLKSTSRLWLQRFNRSTRILKVKKCYLSSCYRWWSSTLSTWADQGSKCFKKWWCSTGFWNLSVAKCKVKATLKRWATELWILSSKVNSWALTICLCLIKITTNKTLLRTRLAKRSSILILWTRGSATTKMQSSLKYSLLKSWMREKLTCKKF